jgi:hypothetical protein
VFTHEHQLSKGPLRIDTVIKKIPDAKMTKTIYKPKIRSRNYAISRNMK